MKLLILILISTSVFSKTHQERYCDSASFSVRLPLFADKLISSSRQILFEEFENPSFEAESPKLKAKKALLKTFNYTEICENKGFVKDLTDYFSDVRDSVAHLEVVRVLGSNPSLNCYEINRSEESWRDFRLLQSERFCHEMEHKVPGLQCRRNGSKPMEFNLVKEIMTNKDSKAQCLLILKQHREVTEIAEGE